MAHICSCQVLNRGLRFGFGSKRVAKLFSSIAYQSSKVSNFKYQNQNNSLTIAKTNLKSQSIKVNTRSLFITSRKLTNDTEKSYKDDPECKKSKEDVDDQSTKKKGQEEDLTEEELQVLIEIEEEERQLRLQMSSEEGSDQLKDYSIWEEDVERKWEKSELSGSLSEGHVPFRDKTRIIQDVIDEMWNPQPEFEEEEELPIIYPRGVTGVFDLDELVELLREENGQEIVAITIPKELDYADHMVIVTVGNDKHLLALATFVRKRFKMKERRRTDLLPFLEKHRNHKGWIALDLGNIILHVFVQEVRDYYDLELLWTVGPLFDDLTNAKDPEIVELLNRLSSEEGDQLINQQHQQKNE